ncbi:hypothetical protein Q3H59_004225 [Pantoea sp. SORGH_AS 659]|nr:hypothetical protein [Pantoea sp. SORGH_AS_0659]
MPRSSKRPFYGHYPVTFTIGLQSAWLDYTFSFHLSSKYPKDLHRPADLAPEELDDVFAWQDLRKLSKALTFQYDKMIYLIDPTDENTRIAGERVTVYEYPDGRIAFRYAHRLLRYQVFDRLACVDQGAIVDNKRLGAVLRLALEKQDEQEA